MRVKYEDSLKKKRSDIAEAIKTSDEVLYKAVRMLYSLNTEDERQADMVLYRNHQGVRKNSIEFFRKAVRSFHLKGFDKDRVRKHVLHYVGQLARVGFGDLISA